MNPTFEINLLVAMLSKIDATDARMLRQLDVRHRFVQRQNNSRCPPFWSKRFWRVPIGYLFTVANSGPRTETPALPGLLYNKSVQGAKSNRPCVW